MLPCLTYIFLQASRGHSRVNPRVCRRGLAATPPHGRCHHRETPRYVLRCRVQLLSPCVPSLLMLHRLHSGSVVYDKELRHYDAIIVIHTHVVIGLSEGGLEGSVAYLHGRRQQSSTGRLFTPDCSFSVLTSHQTRRGCLSRRAASPARLTPRPSTQDQQWLSSVRASLPIARGAAALSPGGPHSAASGRAAYYRQWPCAHPPD